MSVFIPIPKKGNAKECSNSRTIAPISHASKVTLKILQARLQQYVNLSFQVLQKLLKFGHWVHSSSCQLPKTNLLWKFPCSLKLLSSNLEGLPLSLVSPCPPAHFRLLSGGSPGFDPTITLIIAHLFLEAVHPHMTITLCGKKVVLLPLFVSWPERMTPGGGRGSPLQCSCLENPRDRGAWWAAVSGVAQSRTRLKQLSSGSISQQVMQLHSEFVRIQVCILLRLQGSISPSNYVQNFKIK